MQSKKILSLLGLLALINMGLIGEIDALTAYKLRLLKDHKVYKNFIYLERDKSFSLKYQSQDAFIKMPSCLKIYNNNLLIVDNMRHQIKIFSTKGDFLKNIGGYGAGPGDLASPFWLEIYQDKLYILTNFGIDVFNNYLKFEKRIRVFLSISNFFVIDDYIYAGLHSPYKEKYPFFIKMNMDGKVLGYVMDEDIDDHFIRKIKDDIFIFFLNDRFIVAPKHWNKIYIYRKDLNLIKKIKINYTLLDKIEEWNYSREENQKKNSRICWPSHIHASVKLLDDNIYFLLNVPRFEILVLSSDGNIVNHYYNENDFKLMRWIDFDIRKEQEKIVFYLLGNSIADDKPEMNDYNVYRVVVGKKNNEKSDNKKN